MDITLLLPGIIFIGVLLSVLVISLRIRSLMERRKLLRKVEMKGYTQAQAGSSLSITTIIKLYQERIKQSIARIAGTFGSAAKPKKEEEVSHIGKMLSAIGYRGRNVVLVFFGIKFLCIILLPAGLFFLRFLIKRPVPPRAIFPASHHICAAGIVYTEYLAPDKGCPQEREDHGRVSRCA